jgi:hypothetical protein
MNVYQAIGAVSKVMSQEGIGKGRTNSQQGYKFRGIDDVLNALSSALVNAGLVILPRCVSREVVERTTAKGSALFYVTCQVEFDLVSTEDGSKHTVCTYGEAMDSADKATNKAMSAAYKYLALLVFCIPTEATPDTDADYSTYEVAAGMSEEVQADWVTYINDSATAGEMKKRLSEAVAAAMEVNDSRAVDKFNATATAKAATAKAKATA